MTRFLPRRTVRGTILRNRPVFTGLDDRGLPVSGKVRFSQPRLAPGSTARFFHVSLELDDGRTATGYWTPGKPTELRTRTSR